MNKAIAEKKTSQLAAVSPVELATSQRRVTEHCVTKINALSLELKEAEETLDRAIRSKWASKPFRSRVNRLTKKILYFKKIAAAANKGYLIIPDVWSSDLFAIRVKDAVSAKWNTYGSAKIQKLPIGIGEYVDAKPIEHTRQRINTKGKEYTEIYDRTADTEIDFPVSAVHPRVLEAAEIAMADKIFDSMSIARQGGDPFILGQVVDPNSTYKSVSFFVAWFLDLKSL